MDNSNDFKIMLCVRFSWWGWNVMLKINITLKEEIIRHQTCDLGGHAQKSFPSVWLCAVLFTNQLSFEVFLSRDNFCAVSYTSE